ncbi:MAG: DNA topoisomerase (ATP-hydrolyzing) subunit A [Spirochaetes bacterium]|nr:DNA topoisomerase (ATP-hydrolyzing) subunit A [Spirochaetota bacterium]
MAEMTGKIIPIPVEEEVKTAYLNYAMSVIVARALPDVRDGLKPVHRRLLYAMDELGLKPNSATKKSARITGDAMGKYHPHGDLSLYDALVRMAQDFSLRYPLVHGQGNFGSVDGDPPAASRYTEAKLSKVGDEMLADLDKETVDFVPNYDESLKEPSVLPAAFPNLLVNGSSGIAVGMATSMAPHNLVEVCEAIAAYIEDPEISIDALMFHVKGPDFPTGGVIFGRKGIHEAYVTGKGKILVRGRFQIETMKGGREQIVFNEIPYAVNKASLVAKIAELVRDKVIDGIGDVRDESDRDGLRVVIELKKGAVAKLILNQLFAHTQLQSTFGIINLALVDGRPKQLSLKDLVSKFVAHRVDVVTKRTRFDLRKAREREHILQGLVIALGNIDEVVQIIRSSRNTDMAKLRLGERFGLSEIQTQAIVDMRLGRLTTLETDKIEAELKEVQVLIAYLEDLLGHEKKILGVVKEETLRISGKYGDKRRTEIVLDEIEAINIEDLIRREEMVILLSNKGFIKRVPVSAYRSQGRGGKGSNSAALMEDDFLEQLFVATTHDYLLFATTAGKAYWLKVHEIPEATRQARGAHIKSLLAISPNEDISTVVDLKDFRDDEFLFMGTLRGVVKKVATSDFVHAKTRGIIAINLDEGDRMVSSCKTRGKDEVVLITRKGKALRVTEREVRVMGRQSRGVAGIHLADNDELTAMLRVDPSETMLILSEYGYGKRVEFDEYASHGRGTQGQKIYDSDSDKTGEIVGAITVNESDDVVVITSQGKTLKLKASDVGTMGRGARGVRIVNIDRPDFVIGLDRVEPEDIAEENTINAPVIPVTPETDKPAGPADTPSLFGNDFEDSDDRGNDVENNPENDETENPG